MVKQSHSCMDVLFMITETTDWDNARYHPCTSPAPAWLNESVLSPKAEASSESYSLESQRIVSVNHTQMPPPPQKPVFKATDADGMFSNVLSEGTKTCIDGIYCVLRLRWNGMLTSHLCPLMLGEERKCDAPLTVSWRQLSHVLADELDLTKFWHLYCVCLLKAIVDLTPDQTETQQFSCQSLQEVRLWFSRTDRGKKKQMSDYGGVNKGVEVSEGLVASCFHTVP